MRPPGVVEFRGFAWGGSRGAGTRTTRRPFFRPRDAYNNNNNNNNNDNNNKGGHPRLVLCCRGVEYSRYINRRCGKADIRRALALLSSTTSRIYSAGEGGPARERRLSTFHAGESKYIYSVGESPAEEATLFSTKKEVNLILPPCIPPAPHGGERERKRERKADACRTGDSYTRPNYGRVYIYRSFAWLLGREREFFRRPRACDTQRTTIHRGGGGGRA